MITYLHTYRHTYAHTHTHKQTNTHTHTHTNTNTDIQTYIHAHTQGLTNCAHGDERARKVHAEVLACTQISQNTFKLYSDVI